LIPARVSPRAPSSDAIHVVVAELDIDIRNPESRVERFGVCPSLIADVLLSE
jgi:hypothetical protein